jgi:hypothetical protein
MTLMKVKQNQTCPLIYVGYLKQSCRSCSILGGEITKAPEGKDLCRMKVGAGISQRIKIAMDDMEDKGSKNMEDSKEEELDMYKMVFWQRDGQGISKVQYNQLIGQWIKKPVAKCSCASDNISGTGTWGLFMFKGS